MADALPRLTGPEAAQIVSSFCQATGHPVTEPATTAYPVTALYPPGDPRRNPDPYWGSRWRVVFPDQAEAEVDDATGIVCSYLNFAIEGQLANQPEGTAVPEAQAIQRETSVLQATLQTDSLVLDSADLVQEGEPALSYTHHWIVQWRRQYQGIPYRFQNATIILIAETGDVVAVGLNYPSPAPASTAIVITQGQADSIVSAALTRSGIQNAVIDAVATQIVQPNTSWQAGGSEEPLVGVSRVAYVYNLTAGDVWYEVWVDAQDGAVLGGERSESRS